MNLVTGCAEVNSQFDCPMKPGIRCESLDEINAHVNNGEIGPVRSKETVQHIWIAPFEDTAGNYHQANEVYTVAKPGAWMGNPVKESAMDED